MDKPKALALIKDVEAALAAVAAKHNLKFAPTRASFSALGIRIRLEASDAPAPSGSSVTVLPPEAVRINTQATSYGLPLNLFGSKVTIRGTPYTLVGMTSRHSRCPIIASRADGRRFRLPHFEVKQALSLGQSAATSNTRPSLEELLSR